MPSSVKTVASTSSNGKNGKNDGRAKDRTGPAKRSTAAVRGAKGAMSGTGAGGAAGGGGDPRRQSEGDTAKNDAPVAVSEVDRELYNIRMRDLEEKLIRASEERRQCEADAMAAKEQLEKTLTDSTDVIRFLQRSLQSRDDQCLELKERLLGLQLAREQEGADYESRLDTSRHEYEALEQQLTSEIKLLQGKLTSLEEFRLQKEELTARFDQLNETLKEKEEQVPRQLERMERQTLLKVEAMKQSHNEELGQLAEKMEKEALLRLNQESRKALEENTMLLRQVSLLASNLATAESTLTTAKYHNQGLKALLHKSDQRCNELAKHYAAEKQKRKERAEVESLLRDKSARCDALERERAQSLAETNRLRLQLDQARQELVRCQERLVELDKGREKTKAAQNRGDKETMVLAKALLAAKQMLTKAFLTDERDDAQLLQQVLSFLHEDFGV